VKSFESIEHDPWKVNGYMAKKRKTKGKSADGAEQRSIIIRVNIDGWRALRLLSVEQDSSLPAMAIEAFNDVLKKYGKRPIVSRRDVKDDQPPW
jgi:hypothetical protein